MKPSKLVSFDTMKSWVGLDYGVLSFVIGVQPPIVSLDIWEIWKRLEIIYFFKFCDLQHLPYYKRAPLDIEEISSDFKFLLSEISEPVFFLSKDAFFKWSDRWKPNSDPHTLLSDYRILEKGLQDYIAWPNRAETFRGIPPGQVGPLSTGAPAQATVAPRKREKPLALPTRAVAPPKFEKLDDASWHEEGEHPEDLEPKAMSTHIGMFVAWAWLNGWASEDGLAAFGETIRQLQTRAITPHAAVEVLDGKFATTDVNATCATFALSYYPPPKGKYLTDYMKVLNVSDEDVYRVPDTWETFDSLRPQLDKRFKAWVMKIDAAALP